MLAPALAISILVSYGIILWWLLRDEAASTLAWLVGLCGVALALRLVYTTGYPAGFNEDEVKILWCAIPLLRAGDLFVDDCTGVPVLLSAIFEAQLAELIGPSRWALRSYSMLGSVLSVAAGFAAARSLGLRPAPSLAAAGLLAVLPWAILYGRVHQSGDMVFHEMLVVAVLARFIAGRGDIAEVGIGALGLCLLFYGYFSGRALLGLTIVAAVLSRGRHRALCLAIPAVAFLGWLPFVVWSHSPHLLVGLSASQVQGQMAESPLATLRTKAEQAFHALVEPVAFDQWLTVRAGAVHPVWLLALAALGTLTGGRRGLFLWAGFLGGLSPAILGYGPLPSTRRMLMGLPFIALAAGAAVNAAPWRPLRAILAAALVVVAGVQSVRFYFSPDFWLPSSLWVFDRERTALMEELPLPPHPPLVLTRSFGYFGAPRSHYETNSAPLDAANWWPPDGTEALYAFDQNFAPLLPAYQRLFGVDAVRSFGHAFIVRVPAADWSWLRAHGWAYDVSCAGRDWRGQVPFLYHFNVNFPNFECSGSTHTWRGRWLGPATEMRLRYSGDLEIRAGARDVVRGEGWEAESAFHIDPGAEVTIRLRPPGPALHLAVLWQVTPAGNRAPPFEWVEPLAAD